VSKPPDELKPLPKPVRLDVQRGEGRQAQAGRKMPPQREVSPRPPRPAPPPPAAPEKSLRYFEQAQRSHGHRRPTAKAPKKTRKPSGNFAKGAGLVCLGLIAVGLVVLGIIMLTSNNALAVYLNGVRMGYLPRNRETREWDPEYIQAQAVAHRAAYVTAEIHVTDRVSLTPVRANRRYHDTMTGIINKVSEGLTYQIVATAIYVHGERIAVMRTQALARHVSDWFTGAFETEHTIETVIEGWEYRTLRVPDTNLDNADAAIERLDRQIETTIPYIVRDGDTKGIIALRNGIPLSRLLADNDLTPDAIIRPGYIIYIRTTRPFLLVRTIEEETRTEAIPMDIVTNYNENLAVGDINVIQEGREGERNVTVRVTFINGHHDSEEVIRADVITQPETRVVEVGTSETAAPDWRS